MEKKTYAKKGFAIDIMFIVVIAFLVFAIIMIFWIFQTGAVYMIAADISSALSCHLPGLCK